MEYNNVIIVRYSEIHLKGNNRSFFENALLDNLRAAVKRFGAHVVKTSGRYLVKGYDEAEENKVAEAVRCVFGVSSLSCGREIKTYGSGITDANEAVDRICESLIDMCPEGSFTFKVECNRADKRFPYKSPEITAEAGGRLLRYNHKMKVNLYHPEKVFYIDIRETGNTLLYSDVIHAVNGMPVGTGGKGLLLLSGGIDSPVAAYMMAKRGMNLRAIHFHSYPYTSLRAKEKVLELARIVNKYTLHMCVDVVSVTEIQNQIHEKCPEEMMITILRRFMMRIANKIAEKEGLQAIITGESLGQVASQTVESITVTNAVSTLPVLRPLIAFDKNEIIDVARRIGTFETSIQPFEDCCTVFLPKNPVTKPRLSKVEFYEQALDVDALVEEAVNSLETFDTRNH